MVERRLFELLCNYINWIEFLHEEKLKDESTVHGLVKSLSQANETIETLKNRLMMYEPNIQNDTTNDQTVSTKPTTSTEESQPTTSGQNIVFAPQTLRVQQQAPTHMPQRSQIIVPVSINNGPQVMLPANQVSMQQVQVQPSFHTQIIAPMVPDTFDPYPQQYNGSMVQNSNFLTQSSSGPFFGYHCPESQPVNNGYEMY